jgi:HSP20 family protein
MLASEHQRRPFDNFFEDNFPKDASSQSMAPLIDVYQENNEIIIKSQLPGINPEQVEISVDESYITISGENREEKEEKNKNFYHKEISYGNFRRTLPLPVKIIPNKAKANYSNGILTIRAPKNINNKSKTVKIKFK